MTLASSSDYGIAMFIRFPRVRSMRVVHTITGSKSHWASYPDGDMAVRVMVTLPDEGELANSIASRYRTTTNVGDLI